MSGYKRVATKYFAFDHATTTNFFENFYKVSQFVTGITQIYKKQICKNRQETQSVQKKARKIPRKHLAPDMSVTTVY